MSKKKHSAGFQTADLISSRRFITRLNGKMPEDNGHFKIKQERNDDLWKKSTLGL